MRKAAIAILLAMGGCAAVPPAEPEEVPVRGSAGGKCEAGPAQHLVGRASSRELGAEIMRLTGATAFRWIPEDGMVTADYREDRVNVKLDRRNRIVGISCG